MASVLMLTRRDMDFRINSLLVSIIVLVNVLLSSCVTYQIAKYVEGDEVIVPKEELEVGETTLEEALSILGAAAYGTLVRYDSLALFFNTEDILTHKTFAEGSSHPYLRTLFSDQQ